MSQARSTYKKNLKQKLKIEKEYEEHIGPMKIKDYNRLFDIWLCKDGGKQTFLDFMKLESSERKKVMDFMLNSHLHYAKKIGDKKIFFVHAVPPGDIGMMEELVRGDYTLGEAMKNNRYLLLKRVLEEREDKNFDLTSKNGIYTICGHSPIDENIHKDDSHAMIDSACGHNWTSAGVKKEGRLALYCIDDDTIEYVRQKEDVMIKEEKDIND